LDIIFDIDGTLFDISHRIQFALTEPRNWKKFYEEMKSDKPIREMCDLLISTARDKSNRVIFCTGRDEEHRDATLKQIRGIIPNEVLSCKEINLYMRLRKDFRKDYEVKFDLYHHMIADGFTPKLVFEDKVTVVQMWNSIGVRCLRVL
jgi:FMN phosphatase YigB (HAD superfamily)